MAKSARFFSKDEVTAPVGKAFSVGTGYNYKMWMAAELDGARN